MLFQVPLGVILKNENKGDEMVNILIHLQQYIPAIEFKISIVGTREPYEMTDYVVHKVNTIYDTLFNYVTPTLFHSICPIHAVTFLLCLRDIGSFLWRSAHCFSNQRSSVSSIKHSLNSQSIQPLFLMYVETHEPGIMLL